MANIHHSEVRYTPNTLVRTAEHICSKRPVTPRIILNQAKPSAIPRATPPFTQQTSHANPKQSYPRTSSAKRHNKLIMDAHNANPTSRSVALNNFHDMEVPHKTAIGGDMLEWGAVNQSAHQAVTNQLSQLTPDEVWFVSPEFVCGKTWLCLKKDNPARVVSMLSLPVESICPVAHNEEKAKRPSLCFLCSYVKMDVFMSKPER